ncbi:MAG: carboxypeptidase-like regulatory domain-containing protein [Flavisolibacter sp.]|nr:carboxypeptidase-like regulatory domain-containing protein [Flavisolibacter sp.]
MKLYLCFFFSLSAFMLSAQTKVLKGVIRDQHSDEVVPFASVRLLHSGVGKMADSAGTFTIHLAAWQNDTLEITNISYQDYRYLIDTSQIKGDTLEIVARMVPGRITAEVVVKAKVNRGLLLWKRIVAHKPENDRYRFQNFSYELYNKLELDLKNFNRDRFEKVKLLKKFNFILDNIDTSENAPFLPVYLTEAISDYYYQKNPLKRREVFKGVKTLGLDNESVAKLLGGMDQVVNFYNNFIPVFDKQFISPISDNGDNYYKYKIADTQYVAGRRLIHLVFTPKRKGENTFEGDCWVHDTSYAIQKMNLRLSKEANVNFVDRLSLIQEYQLINDSTWFLAKDKFVVDITPAGKTALSFIGRKTTTYRDVVVNDASVTGELTKNKQLEETVLPQDANQKDNAYWQESRHEQLSKNEQGIYKMIDTLMQMPAFKRATKTLEFIGTGYLDIGKYEIGPWQNWITSNTEEGLRLRFDVGTNRFFSKKVAFHTYMAYGFGDQKWKGEGDVFYLLKRDPRMYLYGSYLNDFDRGQNYYDEISSDNIFALAIRKKGVPIKFIRLKESRLDYFKEWDNGFSILTSTRHKSFTPVRNLPNGTTFKDPFTSFEASIRLRYAYLERFLENTFYRTSLGSPYPITELKFTRGISGIFNSNYNYSKLSLSISNYRTIPPLGSLYFNVFGGKTFGTVPYMFLDIAPGNEIYYYNRQAFNLMNRYQYIHDRYAGINIEHNFGNGLFRLIPITRKLKFRQLWTAKALWGGLSAANRTLNFTTDYPFQSLDGKTYLELGTGVDNILKVFRLDLIWRALPAKDVNQRFGVFGSFRFSF